MLEITIKISDVDYKKTFENLEPKFKNDFAKTWWQSLVLKIGETALKSVSVNVINDIIRIAVKAKHKTVVEGLNELAQKNGLEIKVDEIVISEK